MRFRVWMFCVVLTACARRDASKDTARPTWTMTPRGLGPLHVGMTRQEAEAIVGGSLVIGGDSTWARCGYVTNNSFPPGVSVLVENGTIARIDVDSGTTATIEGARVGDSEDHIKSLYGARLMIHPHKYTQGHYLVVMPSAAVDSLYRIVFETDGSRVLKYRSGREPAVEYVERCG